MGGSCGVLVVLINVFGVSLLLVILIGIVLYNTYCTIPVQPYNTAMQSKEKRSE